MVKLVRYQDAGGNRVHGQVDGGMIYPLTGDLNELRLVQGAAPLPASSVKLLAPVEPSKIVAVGPNYFAQLGGHPAPPRPYYWLKPSSGVLDPGGCVVIPDFVPIACHESELAIVIGRLAQNVSLADAPAYILGYTCMNDVTAGNLPMREEYARSQEFVDGKIFNTFAPFGPVIDTEVDPSNLLIQCRINGETRQHHRTSDMIFHPHKLVSMISQILTLFPGDIISTGSPPGVGKLSDGDLVEIEIEGIGLLRHTVAAGFCPTDPVKAN